MKKILLILCAMFSFIVAAEAKKPIVKVDDDATGRIIVLNDSTIEYCGVLGIQVAQRKNVYTAIIRMPDTKKGKPELVIMRPGSFTWTDPDNKIGHYILYSGKSFDRVCLRAAEYYLQ